MKIKIPKKDLDAVSRRVLLDRTVRTSARAGVNDAGASFSRAQPWRRLGTLDAKRPRREGCCAMYKYTKEPILIVEPDRVDVVLQALVWLRANDDGAGGMCYVKRMQSSISTTTKTSYFAS